MKKYLSVLLSIALLITLLVVPTDRAMAASLTLSATKKEVKIGDTITVSLRVPSGYFASDCRISISDTDIIDGNYDSVVALGDAGGQTTQYSFTLTAKAEGTATVTATCSDVSDENGDPSSLSKATLKIVVKNESSQSDKSGDNYLKSLEISEGSLTPSFSKKTTSYEMTVPYSVSSLTISAKANDSKAEVTSVTGNDSLSVGENTVKITVKAEDKTTRVYKILVTREAENAADSNNQSANGPTSSTYSVDGKSYEVLKEIPEDVRPTDFETGLFYIGDSQYPCFDYTNGDIKLVYAAEPESELGLLFIYDHELNSLYPYVRLDSESGYVIVLMPAENLIPEGYAEVVLSIEGKGSVSAYQKKEKQENFGFFDWFGPETVYAEEAIEDDFYLLYCMNARGEKGWYQYDQEEQTYQRVILSSDGNASSLEAENLGMDYKNLEKEFKDYKELAMFVSAIALLIFLIMFVCLIALASSNRKLTRKINGEPDDDEYEDDEYEDDEYEDDEYKDDEYEEVEIEDESDTEADEVTEIPEAAEELSTDAEEVFDAVEEITADAEEITDDVTENSDVVAENEESSANAPDMKEFDESVGPEPWEMPQIEKISKETRKIETKTAKFDTIDLTEISQKLAVQVEKSLAEPEQTEQRPGDVILSPIEERKDLMKRLSEGESVDDDDDDFELLDL